VGGELAQDVVYRFWFKSLVSGVGGGSRHSGVPRILDLQQYASARGPEIDALHAVSRDCDKPGSGSSIPRHLRRRAASHNRRRSYYWNRKKRSPAVIQDSSAQPKSNSETGSETAEPGSDAGALTQEEPQKKRPCRRVRRKFELKGGVDGSGGCSNDGTQRLVTHVCHAKRFSMTKIWGYWLPEGLPDSLVLFFFDFNSIVNGEQPYA